MEKKIFDTLYSVNVNERTEKKNGLTYLSWAWAWAEFVKVCPDAKYEIKMFDGRPYMYDDNLGYMVFTSVTVGDDTKDMWLPVMDGANKAMKNHAYKYVVRQYNKDTRKMENTEKVCAAATMFDINKTIMRCLTKNISMFGLGLYIYAGEDLPEEIEEEKPEAKEEKPKTSLRTLAIEFRKIVPKEAQDKILAELKLERAEDLGMVNLERYIEHYEKQADNNQGNNV